MGFLPKSIKTGQSLVEIMIAMGISAIILPAIYLGLIATRENQAQRLQRVTATNLLREAAEATRVVRENGWTGFAVNGVYHPQVVTSTWTLASASATLDGFTRAVTISDVFRDSQSHIVTTGGTLDPSTKKVDYAVSWTTPFATSLVSTAFLTRYLDNLLYLETSGKGGGPGD